METTKPLLDKWLAGVAAGSIFLFPGFVATVDHAGTILFLLLLLVGLVGFRGGWGALDAWEKAMLLGILFFFLASFLSLLNANDLKYGLRRLEKLARILALIPIYLTIRYWKINLVRPFFWGCLMAGPLMLGVSLYQTVAGSASRSYGAYHPIVFGDQAVLIAGVLGASLCFCFRSRIVWPFALVSMFSALVATGLSGSRGGWIALPLLIVLYLWFFRSFVARWVRVSILVLFFVVTTGLLFTQNPIRERFDHAYTDFVDYRSGNKVNTSLGSRFLMWELAVDIWQQNPIVGTGLGDFSYDIGRKIDDGQTRLNVVWPHAHSIYFDFLATTGLVGLAALVVGLFVMPVLLFYRKIKQGDFLSVAFPAVTGLGCLLSFAIFGLSEAWTARSTLLTSYVVCVLVFTSGLHTKSSGLPGDFDFEPMKEGA